MKAPSTVRLSAAERGQLLMLKRRTGALTWAVLCRFALTASLAERDAVHPYPLPSDGLEIEWTTLGGRHHELYWAALVERMRRDGVELDESTAVQHLRAHLHRGIGLLVTDRRVQNQAGLLRTVLGGAA